MNEIIIKSKKGKIYNMTLDEFTRWGCLIEAVNITARKAEELNILNSSKWIKPIAFQKYINERFLSLRYNLQEELKLMLAHA